MFLVKWADCGMASRLMKISTILQIVFWTALGVFLYVALIWHAFTYSISSFFTAVYNWLKFGFWEVETFASANIINETSWVGINKILAVLGGIPTWWPFLIGYIFAGIFIFSFTFRQALDLWDELTREDEDLYED